MEVRGITISVGYADALRITLPRNVGKLSECMVVTSPTDVGTLEVVQSVPGVRLHVTDAFTRHGAWFNKGLAFEEAMDTYGRHDQLCIWDADIVFPSVIPWEAMRPNQLNGARRRVLLDPSEFRDGLDWRNLQIHRDGGPIGFFQCFNADDPVLRDRRPWYNVNFPHAGGCDAEFIQHWPVSHRCVLMIDVLHLGRPDMNWFGTSPEAREQMAAFVHRMHWPAAMRWHDAGALERVGATIERVEVPGYPTSDFQMPFERRHRAVGGS
jgi:hypothetical protein